MALPLDKAPKALADAARAVPGALQRELQGIAARAVRDIRNRWPVDSGYSRDQWEADGASLVCDAPYASYVRDGLAFRLVPEVLDASEDDDLAAIEEAVTPLLAGAPNARR